MSGTYHKPLPEIGKQNAVFWQSAREGHLSMQQCGQCRHIRYPINANCPRCLSSHAEWVRLSGRGEVLSSVVFHQVYNQAFADDVPYNVSLIQLAEGPRMFSNVVGVAPDQVAVGSAVEVTFDPVTEEIAVPRFRLVEQEKGA